MNASAVSEQVQLCLAIEQMFRVAVLLHSGGWVSEAEQIYQAILTMKPNHFGTLFQLATIRARAKQADAAIELFRHALAADPGSADALAGLGVVLAGAERHDEAIECYERALSINPDHVAARHAFGVILHSLGRPAEAIPHYEKAIALRPGHAGAYYQLGNALQRLGRFDEAIGRYRSALAIDADHLDGHFNLGNALLSLNRHEEAIAANCQVIRLDPTRVGAYNNIGVSLQALGRLDEAIIAYHRALQLAPRLMSTHLNIAYLGRFTADDPRLQALEAIAAEMPTLSEDDQISLHFALGKAYTDLNRHEHGFGHLRQGNALKRGKTTYREKEILDLFERVRMIFNAELIKRRSGSGIDTAVPVFIVGMPRSGTTLVEQILASHSKIYGAGEIELFAQSFAAFRHRTGRDAEFPELALGMSEGDLQELGSRYLAALRSLAPDAQRIVNKLPLNFIFVGLIHLALPNARIIHIRRDPLDTCFSCYSLLFSGNQPFTYDLGELGRFYRGYARMMEHWHAVLPRGGMIDVQYEELVDDFETQAHALVAQCGLEWEDACGTFYKTDRIVATASAVQVRAPVYRTSVGKWRAYEKFLQPLLEALETIT